jgi:transposase
MKYYVGLDVSVKTTAVCIVDENGKITKERSLASEPESLADWLGKTGLCFERVGHEAGPLSSWLHEGLARKGLPVVCVEARHMQTALSAMRNKTDRNDARGIAQMMRTGWFRVVHIKSRESQELRLLLVHRRLLVDKRRDIENAIRGTLKVFGVKVGQVSRLKFSDRVTELVADMPSIAEVIVPMLKVRDVLMEQYQILHHKLKTYVRQDAVCRRLMTAQGVGPVAAASFKSGVDAPERFASSRSVGAHFGITPRRYASGETDRQGRISKCGDGMVRAALYNAAHIVLTRAGKWSSLKAWGLKLAKRAGMEKAKVAVARKLAVILHRMWRDDSDFRWGRQATEATA